ncbi:MAG: DUF2764 family protein, partial [Lentisphaeria bacterium]|nr:DUF2764 family protein [Lentisphaeria bacterium]
LDHCSAFVDPVRMKFLKALTAAPREVPDFEKNFKQAAIPSKRDIRTDDTRVMQLYVRWEICLRNTLARLRAVKLGQDPEGFTVKNAAYDSSADYAARNAFNISDPLEREKELDRARWAFLDGFEWNHSSNFEALCIYRCKLMILEKWAERQTGNGAENLDQAAAKAEQSIKQSQNNNEIK